MDDPVSKPMHPRGRFEAIDRLQGPLLGGVSIPWSINHQDAYQLWRGRTSNFKDRVMPGPTSERFFTDVHRYNARRGTGARQPQ